MNTNFFLLSIALSLNFKFAYAHETYIRINLAGCHTRDSKVAIAFSNQPIKSSFNVLEKGSGKKVFYFQNPYVVYHDDVGDYSTNEPTMNGTACASMLMAYFPGSN